MSDHDYDRPSKRRRRDSASSPPSTDNIRSEQRREHRHRQRSPSDLEYKRKRSQDKERRSDRTRRERSDSFEYDRKDLERSKRRRGSTSRTRDGDTDIQPSRRRHRSYSPRDKSHRHKHTRDREDINPRTYQNKSRRSHSRSRSRSRSPKPSMRSKAPLPSQNAAFTATSEPSSALDAPIEKQKPNFGLSGKLAAASNTVQTANQTIVLKYHEPPEARKPPARDQWRMYVFKGEEIVDTVELSEQSCWLIGREVAVADLPVEHASCSKQHAVIQFRFLEKRNEFGDRIGRVRPYVIDLESANGTMLNEEVVPAAKYVELRDKDVLSFGQSTREYVIQLPSAK